MHKGSSMKTLFAKVGPDVVEFPAQSPNLNPTDHHWDELECWPHPTSIPELTNVAEWAQISIAMLLNLVDSFPITTGKREWICNGMFENTYWCNGQVPTNIQDNLFEVKKEAIRIDLKKIWITELTRLTIVGFLGDSGAWWLVVGKKGSVIG